MSRLPLPLQCPMKELQLYKLKLEKTININVLLLVDIDHRELRKHRLSSELPREPETEHTKYDAHAHSVSSMTETVKSSPEPIGDGHWHDDSAEVHVTVAFDAVDFGDERHQQPANGQVGSRRDPRRLALIDQWERGIIQRGDD